MNDAGVPPSIRYLAAEHSVIAIDVTLAQGPRPERVRSDRGALDLPPSGFHAWVQSEQHSITPAASAAVAGLTCTAASTLHAAWIPSRRWVRDGWTRTLYGGTVIREGTSVTWVAALPAELACSENLGSWVALLPCGSRAGGGSILAGVLAGADYRALTLSFHARTAGAALNITVLASLSQAHLAGALRARATDCLGQAMPRQLVPPPAAPPAPGAGLLAEGVHQSPTLSVRRRVEVDSWRHAFWGTAHTSIRLASSDRGQLHILATMPALLTPTHVRLEMDGRAVPRQDPRLAYFDVASDASRQGRQPQAAVVEILLDLANATGPTPVRDCSLVLDIRFVVPVHSVFDLPTDSSR